MHLNQWEQSPRVVSPLLPFLHSGVQKAFPIFSNHIQRTNNAIVLGETLPLSTNSRFITTDATEIFRTTRNGLKRFHYAKRSCFVVFSWLLAGEKAFHPWAFAMECENDSSLNKTFSHFYVNENLLLFYSFWLGTKTGGRSNVWNCSWAGRKTFNLDFKRITLTRSSFKTDFSMRPRMLMLFKFHISNLQITCPSS